MCVGGVFRFLVIYLGSATQTIAIWKKKKNPSPSPSPSPLVPCTTKPFYWWVGWGHLLDGWAFATLGNSLHKRLLHYYKTDFLILCKKFCKNPHTSWVVCLKMAYCQEGCRVGEVDGYIPVQHRHSTAVTSPNSWGNHLSWMLGLNKHTHVYLFWEGCISMLVFLQSVCQL